jgi:effector-binding domain-containing protein
MLIAQTTTYGDYKESSNSAFKKLAGYIFGDNQTQQDIAMTTPVIQKKQSEEISMTVPVFQEQKQDNWVMSFVLPAKYTLDNVPLPNNKDVNLIQIPKKKIATIRYSGFINQEKMDAYKLTLQEWLESNQYIMASSAYSAAYDPPWTLPFLRRNEIHIEIE